MLTAKDKQISCRAHTAQRILCICCTFFDKERENGKWSRLNFFERWLFLVFVVVRSFFPLLEQRAESSKREQGEREREREREMCLTLPVFAIPFTAHTDGKVWSLFWHVFPPLMFAEN